MTETTKKDVKLEDLFKAGAHFGFGKSRRHPSVTPFIFGSKNRVDIFDLEQTQKSLGAALDFIANLAKENAKILFIGGKSEAQNIVKEVASSIGVPYVASRWIGGTIPKSLSISISDR
jgi:small subunit ribosomal protein S2